MSGVEIYYEPTGCNCDGTAYNRSDINTAATEALRLASEGRTVGRDKYPHAYNDYEHFTFQHAQAPYLEFPITRTGRAYDGQSPGADRIVIGSIADDYSSAVYCAVITHDGQRKNGFAECADDTMNPRGDVMTLAFAASASAV
ncbi:hypothetical protein H2203_008541 [Taxawa tesnikishii (nom. ined.)]|nr:hypothetical protein H2203_008541 [Dothideales sp. JES 119]